MKAFDTDKINLQLKKLEIDKPKYFIGVDTYDENSSAYCLVRKVGDYTEIIMSKSIRDKLDFEKEVKNLTKYFDAVEIKDYIK